MARIAVPEHLRDGAFLVSGSGLGEGRLRGGDLTRPLHGVRSTSDLTGFAQLRGLAHAATLVLPSDAAFSHCTAAALWGLPLPRRLEHAVPLHVSRPTERNRVDRPQVRSHRGLESRSVDCVQGLPVVGLVDTWVDLGGLLGVEDLIVLGDQVARRVRGLEPLGDALAARQRPRGVRGLREALRWIRLGSDSPMETRARLLFCRHGLPEPALNETVAHAGGGFVCRSDFVWRRQRVIGEYQGSDHFESFRRGDDDISRRLLVEDEDWKYLEFTRNDYFSTPRRRAMLLRCARYLGVERVADRPSPDWESRFPTPSTVCARAGDVVSAGRRR